MFYEKTIQTQSTMEITETINFCDQIHYFVTRKHLTDLQISIIKGVLSVKTYEAIGNECSHSESRIRDVACQLWKILSKGLKEPINKSNFNSTIYRAYQSQNIEQLSVRVSARKRS